MLKNNLGNNVNLANKLMHRILKFTKWLNSNGMKSQDQYDFWANSYGILSKKVFENHKVSGIILSSPLVLLDTFMPSVRHYFNSKSNFPIADAHYAMSFMHLYESTQNSNYLKMAKLFLISLLRSSIKLEKGVAWGYPFDWETGWGNYKKRTPLITTTPYCLEAFVKYNKLALNNEYTNLINDISTFLLEGFPYKKHGKDVWSTNYSCIDDDNFNVVNASSYRAFSLSLAYNFSKEEKYHSAAIKYLNFVIEKQNKDGSWFYSDDRKASKFIDHFHTCFILKNMLKANAFLKLAESDSAIEKGMSYYKKNLFDKNGLPIPFSMTKRAQISRFELYDFAESLNILLLYKFHQNLEHLEKLFNFIDSNFITKEGYFVTRKTIFGNTNITPYHRWAQSQMFNSLTQYMSKLCAE